MLQMKLTKQAVDTLRSDGEEVRIWDKSVAGFGVRCLPPSRDSAGDAQRDTA